MLRVVMEWLEGATGNRLPGVGLLVVGLFLLANSAFNWGVAGGNDRPSRLWNAAVGALLVLLAVIYVTQFG
jgi:hypothetical protein